MRALSKYDNRARTIWKWAIDTFGSDAVRVEERASRLLEETAELCQTQGVPEDLAIRIIKRTYSRPAGHAPQEIAGVQLTLEALAYNLHVDIHEVTDKELERIQLKSQEYFQAKHAEKIKDGTGI